MGAFWVYKIVQLERFLHNGTPMWMVCNGMADTYDMARRTCIICHVIYFVYNRHKSLLHCQNHENHLAVTLSQILQAVVESMYDGLLGCTPQRSSVSRLDGVGSVDDGNCIKWTFVSSFPHKLFCSPNKLLGTCFGPKTFFPCTIWILLFGKSTLICVQVQKCLEFVKQSKQVSSSWVAGYST